MFEIIVLRNGIEQYRYPVNEAVSTIGRADNNQIVLAEDAVSRRHARFLLEGQKLFIEDMRSGNGTYIQNQRLDGRRELGNGDEVQIAPFALRVVHTAPVMQEIVAPDVRTVMIPSLGMQQGGMPPQPMDPARTGARMILRRGEAGKSTYTLTTTTFTIGRSEDRDIILTDPASSRRHATIYFMGDHYEIKDEGSANGILINNVQCRESLLNPGDRLVIGETEFEFVWPGAPQRVDQAPLGFGNAPAAPGYPPAHDPYSETGIMPAYPNWQNGPGMPGMGGMPPMGGMPQMGGMPGPGMQQGGYNPGTGYGVEMGAPTTRKRSPLVLVAILILVVAGAAIGIKVVSDKGEPELAASNVRKGGDPCEGVGETCADSSDQTCMNCLNKRSHLGRGQELFGQKDFASAVQEFQAIRELDPADDKAIRFRYLSYEFWVLTAMEDTLRDRSQTAAQKVQKIQDDYAKAKDIYDRYGRGNYTKDTPESTLQGARGQLGEAVTLLVGIGKIKVDDPAAMKTQSEAETLKNRASGLIGRLKVIKQINAQEAFTSGVQQTFEEAMQLKAQGQVSKAAAKFKEVIDKDPQRKTQYPDQARQEMEGINHALKDRAKPLYNEALNKIRTEQWVEARSKLQEALKIDPSLDEARSKLNDVNEECQKRAKKLYSEAKVQFNVSQYPQAEKLLRQVLTFVPDKNDETHQKAEKMLQDMGRNN